MWSAIKNDLFEFVQTVQSDTTLTIAKVIETRQLSNDQLMSSKHTEKEKEEEKIQELTQSYSTYAEDVDQKYLQLFKKFQSNFSLSSHSSDIARILEWETDVSKYYCDLVPEIITAEMFWARYYFKLELVKKKLPLTNTLQVDEDDEEELTWDDDTSNLKEETISHINDSSKDISPSDFTTPSFSQQSPHDQSPSMENTLDAPTGCDSLPQSEATPTDDQLINKLQNENSRLTTRVHELEEEIQHLKDELKYYHQRYPPSSFPNSEGSMSSIDEEHTMKLPVESYVKVNESGGESDGLIILSNDINSDSDAITRSNKNIISSKKVAMKTSPTLPLSSQSSEIPSTSTKSQKKASKILQNPDEEEDEEEVGWDDSGW